MPMASTHEVRKQGEHTQAMEACFQIPDTTVSDVLCYVCMRLGRQARQAAMASAIAPVSSPCGAPSDFGSSEVRCAQSYVRSSGRRVLARGRHCSDAHSSVLFLARNRDRPLETHIFFLKILHANIFRTCECGIRLGIRLAKVASSAQVGLAEFECEVRSSCGVSGVEA
jgi:hypothetical protein